MEADNGWGQRRSDVQLNVLGDPITSCSHDPVTGFFVTVAVTPGHLTRVAYSVRHWRLMRFSNLVRPLAMIYQRRGLNLVLLIESGDQWCLCAARWEQARQADHAPKIRLTATNQASLAICNLDDLKAHAIDLN